ncbi:cytochrome P450 [Colletotrichum orchidophilum]|uniref:Cytochrome P450 n=1 Tax=Colletotrichum orchidophilum TaxID=1209926 RepID=A0A1G4BF13_9PEZI|nr:cytochrome P450 [Colletotrichum orchidophilum]OHE99935.1 cytochrome P450 [Colletotrichum orchidophilum]
MAGLASDAAIVAAVAITLRLLYLRLLPQPIPGGLPYNVESAKRFLGDGPYFIKLYNTGEFWLRFFQELLTKHSTPIAQFFPGPFRGTHVVIGDYREARDLMSRRGKDLSRGVKNNVAWKSVLPEHFIAMEDSHPSFKDAKFLTKDLMTPSFLHGVSAPASYKMVRNFIELWKSKAVLANGRPFDAEADLEAFTYDIMNATAFGISVDDSYTSERLRSLPSPNANESLKSHPSRLAEFPNVNPPELLTALNTLNVRINGAFRALVPQLFLLYDNHRPTTHRAFRSKRTILQSHIDLSVEKLSHSTSKEEFASAVDYIVSREKAAADSAGRKPVFDSARMNDMIWGYLVGGQDSTRSTLCFTAKYLGVHQDVQCKLRETLRLAYPDAVSEQRDPFIDEIIKTHIPYLDAFIEETLRLSSPAGAITKETLYDMDMFGYRIPKGTPLVFLLTGPTVSEAGAKVDEARRSETSQKLADEGVGDWALTDYPPEEFHPERWLQRDEDGEVVFNNRAGPFLSFSYGPRGCWGKRLAYMELKLIVTLLVWNLEFLRLPADLEDDGVVEGLFTKPRSCLVKLRSATATW